MSHIAVLLDDYSIECSCGHYSPNIQDWGNHRATQAWDAALAEVVKQGTIQEPGNPYRTQGVPMSRLAAGMYAFLHPKEVNPPTPYTEGGLRQYDHLHPLEAVLRSWVEPGPRPDWHAEKKEQVRAASPLLARALDRAGALFQ